MMTKSKYFSMSLKVMHHVVYRKKIVSDELYVMFNKCEIYFY